MPSVVGGPKLWFMSQPERPGLALANAGARLRAVRASLGLSQQEMARALHVEPQTWNNWERGRHLVDPLVMARASLRFGFMLDWIYVGSLARLAGDLATDLEARRPDLVLGASPDAQARSDWDAVAPASKSRNAA